MESNQRRITQTILKFLFSLRLSARFAICRTQLSYLLGRAGDARVYLHNHFFASLNRSHFHHHSMANTEIKCILKANLTLMNGKWIDEWVVQQMHGLHAHTHMLCILARHLETQIVRVWRWSIGKQCVRQRLWFVSLPASFCFFLSSILFVVLLISRANVGDLKLCRTTTKKRNECIAVYPLGSWWNNCPETVSLTNQFKASNYARRQIRRTHRVCPARELGHLFN